MILEKSLEGDDDVSGEGEGGLGRLAAVLQLRLQQRIP